jgi:hypothetical protein
LDNLNFIPYNKEKEVALITLSHKLVDLLKPVQKTIVSNERDLPSSKSSSFPLTLAISAGMT